MKDILPFTLGSYVHQCPLSASVPGSVSIWLPDRGRWKTSGKIGPVDTWGFTPKSLGLRSSREIDPRHMNPDQGKDRPCISTPTCRTPHRIGRVLFPGWPCNWVINGQFHHSVSVAASQRYKAYYDSHRHEPLAHTLFWKISFLEAMLCGTLW